MINAKEAREIVEKGKYEKATKQMENIKNEIQTAINNGYCYATFEGCIEASNRKQLEELGYIITSGHQYNESYFSINW